ncbi:transcriptional regulator GcvA [Parvibaculum sp.]|jgi:LysR family glycine cleavage system transcriptional activator|uniref:transcriptional regulator GcvA n=1 Tax=Parvibaculum sp. TaxID=2024848 RepID=UPI001B00DAD1|nr:transcriptional regulator GcvA [Parvibaculum sp.]MBO6634200.1 transcriptional regulator GcvA [Parvibaculum sp.]MBO6677453.1 transcriptional regulator GcvA [Parvibaculum sp.]MBO6685090.1 transcriptional regulator GcvA [Parvibaculum sp.]MBO6905769.1 transcriptional regulator GcvA [Parvibaculum sp.]
MAPRRLPSLKALRAFEAAARHGSFSAAAGELSVTHAAISHQIRALEEDLGAQLFHRTGRHVELNERGQKLFPALTAAFEQMAEAWAQAGAKDSAALTVSVEPSFAARWLVLRLGKFNRAYPEIELRLLPSAEVVDFSREDVDIGVRYGLGGWPDVVSEKLFEATVYPVCAPSLIDPRKPIRKPEDLKAYPLLHEETMQHWLNWLEQAGVKHPRWAAKGPLFIEASLALQAAASGQGVALANDTLAMADLAEGRLVRLFDIEMPDEEGYWLVYPEGNRKPKVDAFRRWIREEAGLGPPEDPNPPEMLTPRGRGRAVR